MGFGAEEGWIQVGNFAGLGAVGEIRMFDTDGNGYFDRWEVYLSNSTRPVRVTQVTDEKARRIDASPGPLAELYANEILPQAKAENAKILEALSALHPLDAPAELRAAVNQGPEGHRRYTQDILRELLPRLPRLLLRPGQPDTPQGQPGPARRGVLGGSRRPRQAPESRDRGRVGFREGLETGPSPRRTGYLLRSGRLRPGFEIDRRYQKARNRPMSGPGLCVIWPCR